MIFQATRFLLDELRNNSHEKNISTILSDNDQLCWDQLKNGPKASSESYKLEMAHGCVQNLNFTRPICHTKKLKNVLTCDNRPSDTHQHPVPLLFLELLHHTNAKPLQLGCQNCFGFATLLNVMHYFKKLQSLKIHIDNIFFKII